MLSVSINLQCIVLKKVISALCADRENLMRNKLNTFSDQSEFLLKAGVWQPRLE
jgi:hypothetical protein